MCGPQLLRHVHNSLPYSLNAEKGLPVMIPPAMSFTLRDLAAPLFRRQRALIFMFLFVFAGVAVIGLSRWHKYEVHLAILVGNERVDPALSAETPLPHEDIDAEADLLRSRDLLQQVVLANRLQSIGQILVRLTSPRADANRAGNTSRAGPRR